METVRQNCIQTVDEVRQSIDEMMAQVVLQFVTKMPNLEEKLVVFDNFFTSYALLATLKKLQVKSTGTVRENRLKLPKKPGKPKKGERGAHNTHLDKREGLLVVQWTDNSTVTMGTNYDSADPLGSVKRYDRKKGEKVNVAQPHVFKEYNQNMGGVDLVDGGVNAYRIAIKAKRWYYVLFTYLIDLAMYNAWRASQITTHTKKRTISWNFEGTLYGVTCCKRPSPKHCAKDDHLHVQQLLIGTSSIAR